MKLFAGPKPLIQFLFLFLIVCLLVTMLPPMWYRSVQAAATSVAYAPRKLEYGVLNAASSASKVFYNQYVKSSSDFNIVSAFGLDYNNSYLRPSLNKTWYVGYDYNTGLETVPVLNNVRKTGGLYVNYRATLYNHLHASFKHEGPAKKLGYQHTRLVLAYEELIGFNSWDQPVTGFYDYGDGMGAGDFSKAVSAAYDATYFKLGLFTSGCTICGDAATSHVSVALADKKGPQILSVNVTAGTRDANGQVTDTGVADTTFKANDLVFIHVTFNEFIRFADNRNTHADVRLKLKLSDLANNQEVEGLDGWADLVGLKDKRLDFLLTVPNAFKTSGGSETKTTNHKITGVSGIYIANAAGQLTSVLTGGSWPLRLLGANGRELSESSLSGLTAEDRQKLFTSKSLITDLAGNPCDVVEAALPGIQNPAILDTTAPQVRDIQLEADGSVNGRVGPGSKLTFSAWFTEKLDLATLDGITATINIQDTAVPVTVQAASKMDEPYGVNGTPATRITFKPLIVTDSMRPLLYRDGQFLRVAIESIQFTRGAADLCGNTLVPVDDLASGERLLPSSAFYLDSEGPAISTTLTADAGRYTPLQDGSPTRFCFSFKVQDLSSLAPQYASGINGTPQPQGSFSLYLAGNPAQADPFEYCVTRQSSLTGSEMFVAAATGTGSSYLFSEITTSQSNDDLYLHIRLLDAFAYDLFYPVLRVRARDLAGNQSEQTFELDYVADRFAPTCSQTGSSSSYDATDRTGSITAELVLTDPSKVDTAKIHYQWVAPDLAPDANLWVRYLTGGDAALSVPLSLTKDNLAAGQVHTYDLYVRAADLSVTPNTGTYGPFRTSRDLTFPAVDVACSTDIMAEPTFTVSVPQVTGTTTNGATALILIKDPLGDSSQYFIRTIDSAMTAVQADAFDKNKFHPDLLSDAQLTRITTYGSLWRHVTLIENADYPFHDGSQTIPDVRYGFTNDRTVVIGDPASPESNRLLAIMNGNYYGDIEITLLTATGITGSQTSEVSPGVYDLNAQNDGNLFLEAAYYRRSDNTFYTDAACTRPLTYQQGHVSNFRKISYIPADAVVNSQSWTLHASSGRVFMTEDGAVQPPASAPAYPDFSGTGPDIHQASIAALSDVALAADWFSYDGPDDGAIVKTSIDNAEFRIDLANRLLPDWQLEDIDFSSPGTYAALYLYRSPDADADVADMTTIKSNYSSGPPFIFATTGTAADHGFICRFPLSAALSQTVTVPTGLAVRSGQYFLYVSLAAKGSGRADEAYYADIFLDSSPVGDTSLESLRTDYLDNGLLDQVVVDCDATTRELQVGSVLLPDVSLPHYIHFRRYSRPVSFYFYDQEDDVGRRFETGLQSIKVWNATPGVDEAITKANADWNTMNSPWISGTDVIEWYYHLAWTADTALVEAHHDNSIYLLSGLDNIIRYQTVGSNGLASEIRSFVIYEDTKPPQLDVRLDSDGSRPVPAVRLFASDATGGSGQVRVMATSAGVNAVVPPDGIELTENATYTVLVGDQAGNYARQKVTINWIDNTSPDLALPGGAIDGQAFSFTAELRGPTAAVLASEKLYLAFPEAYGALLGYTETIVPEQSGGGVWQAPSDGYGGIFATDSQISVDGSGYKKTVTVQGIFKHDPASPGPADRMLTVRAVDAAGNNSAPQTFSGLVTTQATRCSGTVLVDDQVRLNFTAPVVLALPAGGRPSSIDGSPTTFGSQWQDLPIFGDGDQTIAYVDLFGAGHEEIVSVSAFGAYGLDVVLTPASATSGPVTAEITAAVPGTELSLPATIPGAVSQTVSPDRSSVTVVMDQNGLIPVHVQPAGSTAKVREIAIGQIDRAAPAATVRWFYHEFASAEPPAGVTTTNRQVEAWLVCAEPVTGINGKAASIVFAYGGLTSYTFEYADLAGNAGTPITVTLPVGILAEPVVDTTAPDYSLNLYAYDGPADGFHYEAYVAREDLAPAGALADLLDAVIGQKSPIQLTAAWLLDFSIRDDSLTRLLIRPGTSLTAGDLDSLTFLASPTGSVPGVEISGDDLVVRANTAFTLIIIDQNDNRSVLPVETRHVDSEAPTGSITYVPIAAVPGGVAGRRAYIALSDNTDPNNAAGTVSIVDPSGLARVTDAGSPYLGQYIFDFTANTTQQFLLKDVLGVRGHLTATVTDLDGTVPAASVDWWSPCYIDTAGQAVRHLPPQISRDPVTVGLTFNTPVAQVSWQVWDGTGYQDPLYWHHYYLELTYDANGAQVRFIDNISIRLVLTGQNGLVGYKALGIDQASLGRNVIDGYGPWWITATDQPTDGTQVLAVTVRFSDFSEPVYALDCGEAGRLYRETDVIEQEIIRNGTYTYRFVDAAGNSESETVTVTEIDAIPPDIVVSGIPPDGSGRTAGPLVFYATMSEAGELVFNGTTHAVAAPVDKNRDGLLDPNHYRGAEADLNECDWIELSVASNGSYQLTARDAVGLTFYSYVTIRCIDSKAPSLHFSPGTLVVRQGTGLADFEALRFDGVSAQDDLSATGAIRVTCSSLSQGQLDAVGNYELTYTATDEAGNSRTASRFVRVYPRDALTVTLNEIKTDANGTVILSGTDRVSIGIANLPSGPGEPVTVFLKAGIRTAGQMKSGAQRIEGREISLADEGFYTLYLVTQSRVSYLTYFYLEP